MALLEALAAILLIGTAAVALVTLVEQSARALETARATDARLSRAARVLERATIMSRVELEARLGVTRLHGWDLAVERPVPTIFVVTVLDTLGGKVLGTAIYKTEADSASEQ
jgi:hypothetical protein